MLAVADANHREVAQEAPYLHQSPVAVERNAACLLEHDCGGQHEVPSAKPSGHGYAVGWRVDTPTDTHLMPVHR